jgi:signal transduction histidine kinase
MEKPDTPNDDDQRLSALADYGLDYKLGDSSYDEITKIAQEVCKTSVAFISLITDEQQCFKSRVGFELDETPREYAFCAHLLSIPDTFMEIPDARQDHRFHDNPYVVGYPYIVFYAGVPLINPEGYRLGTICVVDGEPGHLSESQVQSLKALANQVVNLMELQKQQQELYKTKQTLQEKNAELQQFAHRAAHDIKSPLKNLSLLTSYLMETQQANLDDEGKKMLQMMGRASQELEDLVEGILAHAESDKALAENTAAIELPAFFEELKSLLDASDACAFHYPTAQQTIYTNKSALKQILTNLISNAIKYCDKPQTVITLDFDESDHQYHVWVRDNGPGISEAYQERIFRMFEVLSNKDRHGQKGTGIGLATVQKLVDGLGGNIEVSSTLGVGTTFKVSISKPV